MFQPRIALRLLTLACIAMPTGSWAAEAFPVITSPSSDGLSFDTSNAFVSGSYGLDAEGPFAVYNQNFVGSGNDGAGWSVGVSNGENGINSSLDGTGNVDLNEDVPNSVPANSVFNTIGNASGKLENGNVLRLSAWLKSDPVNPILAAPQIEPVLKFEFWKEALSDNQDTTSSFQPFFGDKVFDQDINGGQIPLSADNLPQWVDFDGGGTVIDGSAAGQGRVSSINTEEWSLIEVMYTVDDSQWAGINDDAYSVAQIEEIRGVMFFGDFAGTDLTGDGDGGNLLVDNLLMEVFADAASVTANMNPLPVNDVEGLPGDANGDGSVDLLDLDILGSNFGNTPATLAQGDFNGDNIVDLLDLDILGSNFGATSGMTLIPEPASCMIAALAGLMAVAGSRRS